MWFFSKRYFPFWAVFAALLTTACNKDEVILDDRDHAPVITLDSESGVYTVKMGRELTIAPTVEYAEGATYSWIVDGKLAGSEPTYTAVFTELGEVYITFRVETGAVFKFTPDGPGDYTVRVDVTEGGDASERLTRNIVRGVATLSAEIVVHAFADEEQRRRPASVASSRFQHAVYEFLPAPGQLVGEKTEAGYTGNERTHEDAVAYAAGRLEARSYVSLGGFGGYLIVGFDHSIARMESGYDFSIEGNAFDTSSEPGVVWVMQDVNGNGEPDDEWYELRGSETGKEGTVSGYAVTYYRPAGRGMDVQWTDSEGRSGTVEYRGEFHDQDFYYPAWAADTYTLRGTLLESRNMVDDRGFWINRPYEWGYADNYGSDCLAGGDAMDGKGQSNGFRIANAMQPDGTPVELKYIDFVKVQVGVNAKSGPLGEVSTEVFSFADLSIAE